MNTKVFFAVMLMTIGAVSSKRIRYQSCGSKMLGEIIFVDVTPCDQEPCVFRRGRQETVTIKFIPREVITSAKIYAYGMKGPGRISLPINHDACQGYGLTCPLKTGVQAELVLSAKLPEYYIPPGEYALEAHIKDQNNNLVVCGKIDLEVA